MAWKIGIFDSGIGGLTVLKAVRELCIGQEIVYFGDTAKVPYGDKSSETVKSYSKQNVEFLIGQGVDVIVVACNTATAYALEELQSSYSIPLIGVVEPGAKCAVDSTRNGHIGIIGTKGTINSGVYEREIRRLEPSIKVSCKACPLFVPLVEEGWTNHPATDLIIEEYLSPLLSSDVDTLLLGCTHYPLLTDAIRRYCGEEVKIIDSAHACAKSVKEMIGDANSNLDVTKYFVSDDPEKFRLLGKQLLDLSITELFRT